MTHIKDFVLFWYDFIVGDDWAIAVGVVLAVVVSALLVRQGVNAWWAMPPMVVIALAFSLFREARKRKEKR